MRSTHPKVFLVARPQFDWGAVRDYLETVDMEQGSLGDAQSWVNHNRPESDAECLVEFGGRLCYRSWAPGLNANVTRVRQDSGDYLTNIINSTHGSVLEHAQFSFVLHNVSRVLTHELVRHRVGVGISQESMRFVRLTDIPMWDPNWARQDEELQERNRELAAFMERHQVWMADHFGLDDDGVPFSEKKHKTSYMRRWAPDGVSTGLLWSANIRTLRWVVQSRTDAAAEEEIRIVFDAIARVMREEAPFLFADFETLPVEGSDIPMWVPATRKV